MSAEIRIGISGWRGKFYPKDWLQRRALEFATSKFNSIEINGSFFRSNFRRVISASILDKCQSGSDRDVFVYFDNDAKVHAPFDALRLAKRAEP